MATLIQPNDQTFLDKNVRLIGEEGDQLGIVAYKEARSMADAQTLDLVLVSDKSDPAVIKIMDFGKLQYEQKKKSKDQKKHQHQQKVKEVKFRVNIEQHDYEYKIKHAIQFMDKGDKVKLTLMFRGREMAHKDIGFDLITRVVQDLDEYGVADSTPKLMGRNITVIVSPRGKGKRK